MALHRVQRNAEPRGDFLVAESLDNETDDLLLAPGKVHRTLVMRRRRGRVMPHRVCTHGRLSRHRERNGSSGSHRPDRGDEFLAGGFLHDKAADAGIDILKRLLSFVISPKNKNRL